MIADRETARVLIKAAFKGFAGLNDALFQIAPSLSEQELGQTKAAVGQTMGEIIFQIVNPILKQHPELTPEEWKE